MDNEMRELRKVMGTESSDPSEVETKFYIGVEGIEVEMVDWSYNPYRAIFDMVTATWGNDEYKEKWPLISPENRFKVIKMALSHKTLPTALEAPKFTFLVRHVSRAAFDQIARARIGAGFASIGVRDNNRCDAGFRIPKKVFSSDLAGDIGLEVKRIKKLYYDIIKQGQQSWQNARCILPMNITHNFYMTINYLALQGQCSRRLKFCEQNDTCATFWLIRNELMKKFPTLAEYLRPGCDFSGKCQYSSSYELSNAFGCLFKPCGRHPYSEDLDHYEFNESCTDVDELRKDLNIEIPSPKFIEPDKYDIIEKKYFETEKE